ncbi:hypothetical protein FISHEDRAFT_53213 [Fistulina hepatica ATCC 64428]|nr:hypothetical protein FISHEDRAFT_53213 [Fistulina hepatica ATCC 64428]
MSTSTYAPVGFRAEHFDPPREQVFVLPDTTPVLSIQDGDQLIVRIPSTAPSPFVLFIKQERTLRISPHGIVNDDRAQHDNVLLVSAPNASAPISTADFWAALYALFIRHYEDDVVPIALDSTIPEVDDLQKYLTHTGLALCPPGAPDRLHLLLIRAAFWQGAGAPPERSWLRSPIPATGTFPFFSSFTRALNVATTHPLRPPKPAPGSIIYARFIFALGEVLTFTHIDANNPEHFEHYARWQNSERVNVGWRERGPDDKHRAYLADRLADPHTMGFIVAWAKVIPETEPAGYGEVSWVKEDHMGTFVGGLGDYDQGTHLLVGEERFRGRQRFTAVMTSMKHACFLREPRTEVVVGEPRADLPIIPRLIAYLPLEFNREFELPHKRAVYFVLRRERFFQAAILY